MCIRAYVRTQNQATKVLLFFDMTKYFGEKVQERQEKGCFSGEKQPCE